MSLIIYGTEWCSGCKKAKKLAEQYGLNYEWKSVDEPSIYDEMMQLDETITTIPQIVWNDKHIGGSEAFANELQNTMGGYGHGKI
jgi:glutaredoxin